MDNINEINVNNGNRNENIPPPTNTEINPNADRNTEGHTETGAEGTRDLPPQIPVEPLPRPQLWTERLSERATSFYHRGAPIPTVST